MVDELAADKPDIVRQCAALALVANDVIRRLGLARELTFSTYPTRPLAPPPPIDDDEGWADMPHDDVRWLATLVENAKHSGVVPEHLVDPATTDRALREYNRRRIWAVSQA